MDESNVNKGLLEKVELLRNLLIAEATPDSPEKNRRKRDENEKRYKQLRNDLLTNPVVKEKLPRFVITCDSLEQFLGVIKAEIGTYGERRKFLKEAFDPLIKCLQRGAASPGDAVVDERLSKLNSEYVHNLWKRALKRLIDDDDPEGAITLARTLLEDVCKRILDEMNVQYDEKSDLPKLYQLVATHLKLSPSQYVEKEFKQILGSCQAVVEGLGRLRNKLGDAHGRGKEGVRPEPRHAELAVNLAGSVAAFLIATWEDTTGREASEGCRENGA